MVGSGVSIHGVKEIAKVTSHCNFWLRSGKKDRLASMGLNAKNKDMFWYFLILTLFFPEGLQ